MSLDTPQARDGLSRNATPSGPGGAIRAAARTPRHAQPRLNAVGDSGNQTGSSPSGAPAAVPGETGRAGTAVALAKHDPDLLEAVCPEERGRAGRALVMRGYRYASGPIDLAAGGWPQTTFALLVLRGSLVHQTQAVTGRMIAFLSGGDLLMPFDPATQELPGRVSVTATEDVLLAALDHGFLQAAALWPKLMVTIQRRLSEQHHRLALHGAICQLPRVEQRLLALMWHLTDRFGKVTADGVLITRPLNHQTLGYLIGARRPTVTLALKALREREHLRRRGDGTWLLHRNAARLSLEELIDGLNVGPRSGAMGPDLPADPADPAEDSLTAAAG